MPGTHASRVQGRDSVPVPSPSTALASCLTLCRRDACVPDGKCLPNEGFATDDFCTLGLLAIWGTDAEEFGDAPGLGGAAAWGVW